MENKLQDLLHDCKKLDALKANFNDFKNNFKIEGIEKEFAITSDKFTLLESTIAFILDNYNQGLITDNNIKQLIDSLKIALDNCIQSLHELAEICKNNTINSLKKDLKLDLNSNDMENLFLWVVGSNHAK